MAFDLGARISEHADALIDRSGVDPFDVGAVMHGMADHAHLTRVLDHFAEHERTHRLGALHALFQQLSGALGGQEDTTAADESTLPGWSAIRIMASQDVSMGTPAQHAHHGQSTPVPRAAVASVFAAFSEAECAFIVDEVIDGRCMLDGTSAREQYWPEALSLGRYFHAVGDSAEHAGWDR
ncbi:MAG: hypothetical protein ACTH0V_00085 [Microbacteriaceae bacterium]